LSLIETFRQWRIRTPGKIAVGCGEQSWTYAELDSVTDNIAINLLAAGIERGDRVALHLMNGPELAFSYVACLKAGCIAVPINVRLKGREIDYVLRHSGAVCYVGQPDLFAAVANLPTRVPGLDRCFLTRDSSDVRQARSFAELLRSPGQRHALPDIASHQTAAILYTSGTAARPKGVTHSHETLLGSARAMHDAQLNENQIVVVMSSMAHMAGFGMLFLPALLNGATVAITPVLDPGAVLQTMERWRGTYALGLPAMFHGLVQAQIDAPRDVSSGRVYFCGGDWVSPQLQAAFRSAMGQPVCEIYGATEIAPIAWNRPGHERIGSFGQAAQDVDFRLLDGEYGDVEPGEVGEVCVRSTRLMTGYWQDKELTASAVRSGWYHTGDLARLDADGFYWFAGRKKDVIIRGGSNISPQEVEAALCEHPSVSEVAVIGRKDPVLGETVAACVVLRQGHAVAELELIAFVRDRLADYKTPERVFFLPGLPKGPAGKILRRALREMEPALSSWYGGGPTLAIDTEKDGS
jgi:long-chain acyl-CoA synthetase